MNEITCGVGNPQPGWSAVLFISDGVATPGRVRIARVSFGSCVSYPITISYTQATTQAETDTNKGSRRDRCVER